MLELNIVKVIGKKVKILHILAVALFKQKIFHILMIVLLQIFHQFFSRSRERIGNPLIQTVDCFRKSVLHRSENNFIDSRREAIYYLSCVFKSVCVAIADIVSCLSVVDFKRAVICLFHCIVHIAKHGLKLLCII